MTPVVDEAGPEFQSGLGAPGGTTSPAGAQQAALKIGMVLLSSLLYSISIASVGLASRFIPPLTLTILRLAIASGVLGLIIAVTRPRVRWRPRQVCDIFLVGLGNVGLPFVLLGLSMRYISSSLASILFNLGPPLTLLMAHFALRDERLTRGKVLGTATAVGGAVLIMGSNASGRSSQGAQAWLGQLLIIVAAAAGAAALVYTRRFLREEQSLVLAGGQVFASLVALAPIMLALEGIPNLSGVPPAGWAAVLAAGIAGPVLAFWLLFHMVNKFSASLGGFSSIGTPLFSAVIGVLFLGEVITLPIALGTMLLLAGIWSLNVT